MANCELRIEKTAEPLSQFSILQFSIPPKAAFPGAVAQLGEHLLCKQRVVGSIPISSTISSPEPVRITHGNRNAVAEITATPL